MQKWIIMAAGIILVIVILAGCTASSAATLKIENPWSRPAMKDGSGAVYFVVNNSSGSEDKLVGVSTDVCQTAEMHITKMDKGVMVMEMQPEIKIPGGGKLEFKPGGHHIMLLNLKNDLKPNDTVKLTLKFEKAGPVEVTATVREP